MNFNQADFLINGIPTTGGQFGYQSVPSDCASDNDDITSII